MHTYIHTYMYIYIHSFMYIYKKPCLCSQEGHLNEGDHMLWVDKEHSSKGPVGVFFEKLFTSS